VKNECRGNDAGGARWKLNVDSHIPEDHVPPHIRIKFAKGCDCAPAKSKIGAVYMGNGDNIVTNVESGGGPQSIPKVGLKALCVTCVMGDVLI